VLLRTLHEDMKPFTTDTHIITRTQVHIHTHAHTYIQTLARMMREEMKRSMYLCINIVSVFFSISNFSQFHQTIMDHQVCP
jgi:tRNA A37 threonylcarbamoyladenosine dehydratase